MTVKNRLAMRLTPKYYFLTDAETGHPKYGLFSAMHTPVAYDVFFGVYSNIRTQLLGRTGVSVKSCQHLAQVTDYFVSSAFPHASMTVYDSFFGEFNTVFLSPDDKNKSKEDSDVSGNITAKPNFTSTRLSNLLNIHYASDTSDRMGFLLARLGLFNAHMIADKTRFVEKGNNTNNTDIDTTKNKNSGFNHT